MDSIIEKIRKLLAKAESNNEHEAEAALLKARELMAKYKVDERSVKDAAPRKNELKHIPYCADSFSAVRNVWFVNLSKIIAENHCCAALERHQKTSRKHFVLFTGLDDDPAVALEMFSYAVQHIKDRAREFRRSIVASKTYSAQQINVKSNAWEYSYAAGFISGLAAKYEEQIKHDESGTMALVLVQPVEVTEYTASLPNTKLNPRRYLGDEEARQAGYNAGYKFNPVKQIAGKEPMQMMMKGV